VDVLQDDPQWAEWSIGQLRAQSSMHQLAINPIIFAETSLSFSTLEALDSAVTILALEHRRLPRPALFLAAKADAQYRRRGGSKTPVLPDFFIDADAAVEGWALLTRDASRLTTYFPTLEVLAP
jgi:predicted nucleic acid-binding protein